MPNELTALPESFSAGTTVAYTKSFTDYPASTWTLTLYIAGVIVDSFVAVADGDAFLVTIPADTALEPGYYQWVERVAYDGAVYEVDAGKLTVNDNLATARDGDSQLWLERAIPVLRAHVEGRLTAGMHSYAIAGRAVTKIPIDEAVKMLDRFEGRLARIKNPDKVSRLGVISFVKPGTEQ
jgi:hypothetical protein